MFRFTDCSVCSEDYSSGLGPTCKKCVNDAGSVAIVGVISVLAMVAFIFFVTFMVSTEKNDSEKGTAARMARLVPVQSLKIAIVSWQIITQVS